MEKTSRWAIPNQVFLTVGYRQTLSWPSRSPIPRIDIPELWDSSVVGEFNLKSSASFFELLELLRGKALQKKSHT